MLQFRIFAACILRLDLQNLGEVLPATCRAVMLLIRLAALSWKKRPDFAFALLSAGSFAPIVKWSTRPHGLFTRPAALHAWERTCRFKHCSYVILTSNTDGIRGVSIVKNIAAICHYNFRRTFRCDVANTDTCVKNPATYYFSFITCAYGFLQGYVGWHSWLNIEKNRFYLKDVANGARFF